MKEGLEQQGLSVLHESVLLGAERARLNGREELWTVSELPGELVRRARANLKGRVEDWTGVYEEVIRVAMGDLGVDEFDVETSETERFDDGQPGFFLVRKDVKGPDFRFGESVAGELLKNKRTASGERVNRQ